MYLQQLMALANVLSPLLEDNTKMGQEKVDYYRNLYFTTKKRKDLRRKAKTRKLKYIESEWRFWKTLRDYTNPFNNFKF
jgi:hypothetical protein